MPTAREIFIYKCNDLRMIKNGERSVTLYFGCIQLKTFIKVKWFRFPFSQPADGKNLQVKNLNMYVKQNVLLIILFVAFYTNLYKKRLQQYSYKDNDLFCFFVCRLRIKPYPEMNSLIWFSGLCCVLKNKIERVPICPE